MSTLEELLLFLVQRVNALDVEITVAIATGDDDAVLRAGGANDELIAIIDWVVSARERVK